MHSKVDRQNTGLPVKCEQSLFFLFLFFCLPGQHRRHASPKHRKGIHLLPSLGWVAFVSLGFNEAGTPSLPGSRKATAFKADGNIGIISSRFLRCWVQKAAMVESKIVLSMMTNPNSGKSEEGGEMRDKYHHGNLQGRPQAKKSHYKRRNNVLPVKILFWFLATRGKPGLSPTVPNGHNTCKSCTCQCGQLK